MSYLDPIPNEPTQLTDDMLRAAFDDLARRCPGCVGTGHVPAESIGDVIERLELGAQFPSQRARSDGLMRHRGCPACNGTGRMSEP